MSRKVRLYIATLILLLIVMAGIVWQGKAGDVNRGSDDKMRWRSSKELTLGRSGMPIPESGAIYDILKWMEENIPIKETLHIYSVYSGKYGFDGIVFMHETGSGRYIWNYIVYQRIVDGDKIRWKWVHENRIATDRHPYGIRSVYIDDKDDTLTFIFTSNQVVKDTNFKRLITQMAAKNR